MVPVINHSNIGVQPKRVTTCDIKGHTPKSPLTTQSHIYNNFQKIENEEACALTSASLLGPSLQYPYYHSFVPNESRETKDNF